MVTQLFCDNTNNHQHTHKKRKQKRISQAVVSQFLMFLKFRERDDICGLTSRVLRRLISFESISQRH